MAPLRQSRWSLHTWRQRRAPGRPWRKPSMWRAMVLQGVPWSAGFTHHVVHHLLLHLLAVRPHRSAE
jgi:hypothetical protein